MQKVSLIMGIIFLSVLITTNAQSKFGLGIYGGISMPTSEFNNFYNPSYTFNGTVTFLYRSNLQISLLSGYSNWEFDNDALNNALHEENFEGNFNLDSPVTGVPLKLQLKYLIGKFDIQPYLLVEGGIYFLQQTLKGTYENNGNVFLLEEEKISATESTLGAGAGILIPLSSKILVDLNAKYCVINDSEYISEQIEEGTISTSSLSQRTASIINIVAGINYNL